MIALKDRLVGSLFIEECRQAIETARETKAEFRLNLAAQLLDSPDFKTLPASEQNHLLTLFSEAAFAVTGYGV